MVSILVGVVFCYLMAFFMFYSQARYLLYYHDTDMIIQIFLVSIYPFIIALIGTVALMGLAAKRKWGRRFGIAAAAIGLPLFPGTFICIFALVYLTSWNLRMYLEYHAYIQAGVQPPAPPGYFMTYAVPMPWYPPYQPGQAQQAVTLVPPGRHDEAPMDGRRSGRK